MKMKIARVPVELTVMLSLLSGCGTLPKSGPTAAHFIKGGKKGQSLDYRIIELDGSNTEMLNATANLSRDQTLPATVATGRLDVIYPGDVLQVVVHEVGISLFGGNSGSALQQSSSDYSAHSEPFTGMVVDQDGMISLPYLGRIMVAGASVTDAQSRIERTLAGKSQMPQVTVSIADSRHNSVYLSGAVRKPGRMTLNPAGDMLLDVVAAAGGSADQSYNAVLRFTRGAQSTDIRLSAINPTGPSNIQLLPGDRIELLQKPLTFTAMGATNRVAQIAFEAEHISLAEALAKSSGLNDNQADPKAVFLFRMPSTVDAGTPLIIYRLNMMNAQSYFLAQNIEMQDKDLIYVANAQANLPLKLVSIINQLTSPLVTYKALSQ